MGDLTVSSGISTLDLAGIGVRVSMRGQLPGHPNDLPVVVLHGWGAHLEAVEPIIAALEQETLVLALDLPGFGASDPPPEPWSVERYAGFILKLLDRCGIERCHVLGHSFGGRVAICLAADHPERVERLLLCDAAGLLPRRGWRYRWRVAGAKVGRILAAVGGKRGRRVQDRMRRRLASADYLSASETMRGTFRLVIAEDLAPRLQCISAAALLVWGEDDQETPVWMGERMQQLIPDAGLVVLPSAGHYSYADQPGHFCEVARLFLCVQPRRVTNGGPE